MPGPACAARSRARTTRQHGFAYVAVLLFLALFGAVSANVAVLGRAMGQRSAEEDLLFVGMQFRDAIRSYYEARRDGVRYPRSLDDLLLDKRFPATKRHLRKVFTDPMTGGEDWGLVTAPGGGVIMGVYSKASATPLKVDGFPPELDRFKDSTTFAQWQFVFIASPLAGAAASSPVSAPAPRQ